MQCCSLQRQKAVTCQILLSACTVGTVLRIERGKMISDHDGSCLGLLLPIVPASHLWSQHATLLLHLIKRTFALVVALAVITTLMVAAQRCLHLFFEPWHFWTRAILVAHVVMETLLVAHHDLCHLLAVLAQFPPISLALIPATRVPSTFHGTGDGLLGAWRRLWQCWHSWSHSREWLHHWLCHHWINHSWTSHSRNQWSPSREWLHHWLCHHWISWINHSWTSHSRNQWSPRRDWQSWSHRRAVEVTIIVMMMMEITIMVMMEVTIMVMMEVTIMVMVEVIMVAKTMLSEELPQTSLGTFTMATEVMAFLVAALTFREGLAFHENLLHWFGAHVMAFTVSTTLSVAFHGFLNLRLHMWATGQRTLLVALMIMTTRLMTFHDGNSFITSCLEFHPKGLWALFLTKHIITTLCMANSELGHNELCRRGLEVLNPFMEAMRDVPLWETAASVDKHLHWTIADLAATTIGTALLVALDDAFHLSCHLRA